METPGRPTPPGRRPKPTPKPGPRKPEPPGKRTRRRRRKGKGIIPTTSKGSRKTFTNKRKKIYG